MAAQIASGSAIQEEQEIEVIEDMKIEETGTYRLTNGLGKSVEITAPNCTIILNGIYLKELKFSSDSGSETLIIEEKNRIENIKTGRTDCILKGDGQVEDLVEIQYSGENTLYFESGNYFFTRDYSVDENPVAKGIGLDRNMPLSGKVIIEKAKIEIPIVRKGYHAIRAKEIELKNCHDSVLGHCMKITRSTDFEIEYQIFFSLFARKIVVERSSGIGWRIYAADQIEIKNSTLFNCEITGENKILEKTNGETFRYSNPCNNIKFENSVYIGDMNNFDQYFITYSKGDDKGGPAQAYPIEIDENSFITTKNNYSVLGRGWNDQRVTSSPIYGSGVLCKEALRLEEIEKIILDQKEIYNLRDIKEEIKMAYEKNTIGQYGIFVRTPGKHKLLIGKTDGTYSEAEVILDEENRYKTVKEKPLYFQMKKLETVLCQKGKHQGWKEIEGKVIPCPYCEKEENMKKKQVLLRDYKQQVVQFGEEIDQILYDLEKKLDNLPQKEEVFQEDYEIYQKQKEVMKSLIEQLKKEKEWIEEEKLKFEKLEEELQELYEKVETATTAEIFLEAEEMYWTIELKQPELEEKTKELKTAESSFKEAEEKIRDLAQKKIEIEKIRKECCSNWRETKNKCDKLEEEWGFLQQIIKILPESVSQVEKNTKQAIASQEEEAKSLLKHTKEKQEYIKEEERKWIEEKEKIEFEEKKVEEGYNRLMQTIEMNEVVDLNENLKQEFESIKLLLINLEKWNEEIKKSDQEIKNNLEKSKYYPGRRKEIQEIEIGIGDLLNKIQENEKIIEDQEKEMEENLVSKNIEIQKEMERIEGFLKVDQVKATEIKKKIKEKGIENEQLREKIQKILEDTKKNTIGAENNFDSMKKYIQTALQDQQEEESKKAEKIALENKQNITNFSLRILDMKEDEKKQIEVMEQAICDQVDYITKLKEWHELYNDWKNQVQKLTEIKEEIEKIYVMIKQVLKSMIESGEEPYYKQAQELQNDIDQLQIRGEEILESLKNQEHLEQSYEILVNEILEQFKQKQEDANQIKKNFDENHRKPSGGGGGSQEKTEKQEESRGGAEIETEIETEIDAKVKQEKKVDINKILCFSKIKKNKDGYNCTNQSIGVRSGWLLSVDQKKWTTKYKVKQGKYKKYGIYIKKKNSQLIYQVWIKKYIFDYQKPKITVKKCNEKYKIETRFGISGKKEVLYQRTYRNNKSLQKKWCILMEKEIKKKNIKQPFFIKAIDFAGNQTIKKVG